MKNFIFISPNFPTNYWLFCRELKKNGINVLGIGDQPYDELSEGLKDSLAEYYKVSNLENDDEVYRAVAFLTYKHGRIHWLGHRKTDQISTLCKGFAGPSSLRRGNRNHSKLPRACGSTGKRQGGCDRDGFRSWTFCECAPHSAYGQG